MLRNRWVVRSARLLGAGAAVLIVWLVHTALTRPMDGSHVFTPFDNVRLPLQRTAPDGTAYTVDPGRAVFALDMADEDAASRRVFPSYAAALRHAREQGLPTMPSVPLVLAAGRALETRLQMALERRLDQGDDGRPALLRRWLAVMQGQRATMTEALRPASDRAMLHLAEAIALDEGQGGGDTALGPWGEDEDLRRVWRRDRHLADALVVDDEQGAVAAALLARALSSDPALAAGWARQAAVARAWAGAPGGATFEELAPVLTGIADADLAATVRAVVARRQRPDHRASVAPAALAWVASPEEQVLAPRGPAAWNDPVATLIAAIDDGSLDLAPAADAGFYRRRWHALETLAAPRLAPEAQKLQLTADYLRRWRRAFAAGFSEGRSGLVKRLPELCAGISDVGPVRVEVAPQFTAEPAPIVYLRLGRAYRALAGDLERSLGAEAWQSLRDAGGTPLAAAVVARADLLFGLGSAVSAELGFPLKPTADEAGLDAQAALAAARRWACADDPDVAADARLLVTLAQDSAGRHRCPAILGVRLEPVIYRWVEEPAVSGDVDPLFVPARCWLPSPCPATITVETVPDPPSFRARCDGHAEVASLYAAFGLKAPALRETQRPWWPWPIAGIILFAAVAMACIGWRRLPQASRVRLIFAGTISLAILLTWLLWFPPYAVVRFVAVTVVQSNANIALVCRGTIQRWGRDHGSRLFIDLISDPDPQIRYLATWLPISISKDDLTDAADVLRRASDDPLPEVAWLAWHQRCRSSEPTSSLLADLERTASSERLWQRLLTLIPQRPSDANLPAAALRLADTPDNDRRTAVLRALRSWDEPPPAVQTRLRNAITDPHPPARGIAAGFLGERGTAADIPVLLRMLQDAEAGVRMAAFRAVGQRAVNSEHPKSGSDRPSWSDPTIQGAILRYAGDPGMTADERLSAGWRITDPAIRRRISRELLAVADALPETGKRNAKGDQFLRTRWNRTYAHAHLVYRWLASGMDETASYESDGGLQEHPTLLAPLLQAMRDGSEVAAALPILERSLVERDTSHVVLQLIEGIGPPAAPLADAVIAFHLRGAENCERWHTLSALAAMGPAVADRAEPLLREAALDPDYGWRVKRLLEPPTDR